MINSIYRRKEKALSNVFIVECVSVSMKRLLEQLGNYDMDTSSDPTFPVSVCLV